LAGLDLETHDCANCSTIIDRCTWRSPAEAETGPVTRLIDFRALLRQTLSASFGYCHQHVGP